MSQDAALRDAGGLRPRAPQGSEGGQDRVPEERPGGAPLRLENRVPEERPGGAPLRLEGRPRFDAPDAVHHHGRFLIRRVQPSDALAYCRADARFVADTYTSIMPPEFAVERLAEADGLAPGLADRIGTGLAAEATGDEPRERTWIALDGDEIVATCISSAHAQDWESINDVVPIPGATHQLNHLYLDRSVQGSGLADVLMRLALPGDMPAYLWIVGGNERARRFYERYGFVGDGITYGCGPIWYHRTLLRMYRV